MTFWRWDNAVQFANSRASTTGVRHTVKAIRANRRVVLWKVKPL